MECHIAHNILVVGFGVVEFFVVHYETTLRTKLHILYPCLADLFRVLLMFLALVFCYCLLAAEHFPRQTSFFLVN